MIDDSSWPRLVRPDRGVILMVWYCVTVQAPQQVSTAACAGQGPTRRDQVRVHRGDCVPSPAPVVCWHGLMAALPGVNLKVWRAGAATDVNCSLCQAGTYGTGSGA
jgi:hypothetical protein